MTTHGSSINSGIDAKEHAHFSRFANQWHDSRGPFGILHKLNPVRLEYIRNQVCAGFHRSADSMQPLKDLRILDVGCGGGILTEPLARMGADISGIDMVEETIIHAREHAKAQGLKIHYSTWQPEAFEQIEEFDVICAMEVIEHVADPAEFLNALARILKPDGMLILSTPNRTLRGYAMGIFAAENILNLVPRGTHDWHKFRKPSEVAKILTRLGMDIVDISGLKWLPLRGFHLSGTDLALNYFMTARLTETSHDD